MTFFMGGGGGAKSQAKQKVSTIPLKSLKLMNDYKDKVIEILKICLQYISKRLQGGRIWNNFWKICLRNEF